MSDAGNTPPSVEVKKKNTPRPVSVRSFLRNFLFVRFFFVRFLFALCMKIQNLKIPNKRPLKTCLSVRYFFMFITFVLVALNVTYLATFR